MFIIVLKVKIYNRENKEMWITI